jgi:hypothetical protein
LVRFDFYKKIIKLKYLKKKPKPIQTDRFQFGLVFYDKNRFKPVWLGFFPVFFVWVRFGFFDFILIKLKPNRTGRFFQNFNWFSSRFGFFDYFFSGLIDFFIHPYYKPIIVFFIFQFLHENQVK